MNGWRYIQAILGVTYGLLMLRFLTYINSQLDWQKCWEFDKSGVIIGGFSLYFLMAGCLLIIGWHVHLIFTTEE